jgi:hypothetical protein
MKQTAVEKLGITFRQWQTDWDNFDKTGKNKPVSYDEFLPPFLEMEKEQIIHAYGQGVADEAGEILDATKDAEQYYNQKYKSK